MTNNSIFCVVVRDQMKNL